MSTVLKVLEFLVGWKALVYCLVFCIASCVPVHEVKPQDVLIVTHTPHLWSCLLRFVEMWGENTSRSNGSTQLSRVSVTWSRRSGNSELSFSPRPVRMDIMNLRSNNICNAWFWVKFDLCSWTNFSCVNRTPCDRLVTSSCSNFLSKKQTDTST